ncbi:hypothetical protein BASA81_002741 [Batrachochytrium salamandrivorans]|nr:hypothetical protein BASA81_002741 [Batrachochytrium salamandrivorans]
MTDQPKTAVRKRVSTKICVVTNHETCSAFDDFPTAPKQAPVVQDGLRATPNVDRLQARPAKCITTVDVLGKQRSILPKHLQFSGQTFACKPVTLPKAL